MNDSLERLVNANPKQAIGILEKQPLIFSNPMQGYLLSSAYTNYGQYVKSDSLVTVLLNQGNFNLDSSLYMRMLLLHSENKKVLNYYEDGFVSLTKMYDYYSFHRNDSGLLEVYLAFAEFYRAANNFSFGLQYIKKVDALIQSMQPKPSPIFTMRMLHRKAAIFAEQSQRNDSVIPLALEVIKLGNAYNEPKQVAIASNELGFYLYNIKKQPKLAEQYLQQAYHIWDSLDYPLYITNASFNLAKLYAATQKYDLALKLSNQGLQLVKENQWKREEAFWYELLADIYKAKQQYKLAYEYEHRSKQLLTHYAYEQFKERLAFYSNQLSVKEKEEEVFRTHLELESKQSENKLLFTLLLAVSVLLVIAVSGYIINRRQKRIMAKQQSEISKINIELSRLLDLKEVLVKEVNHRVKNNLSLLSGLMYLKQKELSNPESISLLSDMQIRINTISLIHETLYQREDVEHIDFQEYLERLSNQTISLYAGTKAVTVTINCLGFEPKLSLAIPLGMILNELFTNSLKHAFLVVDQPLIDIAYNPDSMVLSYSDNGPGFNPNNPSNSLGSKLIQILATQLEASIQYQLLNKPFTIYFDISKSIK